MSASHVKLMDDANFRSCATSTKQQNCFLAVYTMEEVMEP